MTTKEGIRTKDKTGKHIKAKKKQTFNNNINSKGINFFIVINLLQR